MLWLCGNMLCWGLPLLALVIAGRLEPWSGGCLPVSRAGGRRVDQLAVAWAGPPCPARRRRRHDAGHARRSLRAFARPCVSPSLGDDRPNCSLGTSPSTSPACWTLPRYPHPTSRPGWSRFVIAVALYNLAAQAPGGSGASLDDLPGMHFPTARRTLFSRPPQR